MSVTGVKPWAGPISGLARRVQLSGGIRGSIPRRMGFESDFTYRLGALGGRGTPGSGRLVWPRWDTRWVDKKKI